MRLCLVVAPSICTRVSSAHARRRQTHTSLHRIESSSAFYLLHAQVSETYIPWFLSLGYNIGTAANTGNQTTWMAVNDEGGVYYSFSISGRSLFLHLVAMLFTLALSKVAQNTYQNVYVTRAYLSAQQIIFGVRIEATLQDKQNPLRCCCISRKKTTAQHM